MKICNKCGASKQLSQFHKNSANQDGHVGMCKECACIKSRNWYSQHRRHVLEYQAKYYESHKDEKQEYDCLYRKDNQQKLTEKARHWASSHPDKRRTYQKRYRDKHGDKLKREARQRRIDNGNEIRKEEQRKRDQNRQKERSRLRAWKRNHPNRVKADKENRRAKQSNIPGKFTEADIQRLYNIQDGVCVYHDLNPSCLADLNFAFHIDHIVPIIRGGSNYSDNLQLLCHLCNEAKGRKTDKEFRDWLAYIYPK